MKYAPLIIVALIIGGVAAMYLFSQDKPVEQSVTTEGPVDFAYYLDVRSAEERSIGYLEGAIHFDLERMRNGELPDLPKDAAIGVYCASGNRAGQAITILAENGFTNLTNLGGLEDLRAQGRKICPVDCQ